MIFNKSQARSIVIGWLFMFVFAISLQAQSRSHIDSLISKKINSFITPNISLRGKLSLSSDLNMNIANRDVFLNYKLQSNLNANFYGITLPLSFSYSNGRTTYGYDLNPIQLPSFKRIGLSPSYEALTLHLGYRQLNYTKYTLNGLQFKGIGIEYEPKGYYFSVMKGVLKPAVQEDFTDISLIEPSFQRNGWALKAGLESESLTLGLALLSVLDDPNSIENPEHFPPQIRPRENAVVGVYLKKNIVENLQLDVDYAFSALSHDIIDDPIRDISTQYTAYNYFGIFTTREHSIYDKAIRSSLSYDLKFLKIAYNFEKVDPDFRTLGSFFFTNNFITRTGSITSQLIDEKLLLNFELGKESQAETQQGKENLGRIIGSLGVKYKHSDQLTLNGKYSNLNNSNLVRKPSLQSSLIDSILQTQTKEKIHLGANYTFGEEKNHSINLFSGYQRGLIVDKDLILTLKTNTSSNVGLTYSTSSKESSNSLSYSISSIKGSNSNINSQNVSHSFTKFLSDKSDLFVNTSLNLVNAENSQTMTLQNEIGYNLKYKDLNQIKISLSTQIGKSKSIDTSNSIFLIVFKLTYDFAFSYRK